MYRTTSIDMDMHQFNSDHNRIHSALLPFFPLLDLSPHEAPASELARSIHETDEEVMRAKSVVV